MPTSPTTAAWRAEAKSYGRILLYRGDITGVDTDAIVNAANSSLLGVAALTGPFTALAAPKSWKLAAACGLVITAKAYPQARQLSPPQAGCLPGTSFIR
ncbi:hypothetical protein [Hymenobacter volaticus]|uniref:hypothetical protein n=1 Tax=Hymenobacter volaticus TaxID=2932254 RepID=UPI0028805B9A|nr:hypothetical protein [Hymenobacter volaticus]